MFSKNALLNKGNIRLFAPCNELRHLDAALALTDAAQHVTPRTQQIGTARKLQAMKVLTGSKGAFIFLHDYDQCSACMLAYTLLLKCRGQTRNFKAYVD